MRLFFCYKNIAFPVYILCHTDQSPEKGTKMKFNDILQNTAHITSNNESTPETAKLNESITKMEYLLRVSEQTTMQLRKNFLSILENYDYSLPESLNGKKKELLVQEKQNFHISVSYDGRGFLEIHVPALLPHRKSMPGTFFYAPLTESIMEFMKKNNRIWKQIQNTMTDGAVLVIRHNYATRAQVRDNDNIELKSVIDCFCTCGLLKKDTGDYLSVFSTAGIKEDAKSESTVFFVMPNPVFSRLVDKFLPISYPISEF